MTDIEISRNSNKKPIKEIAKSIGISENELILYGDYKAKIKCSNINPKGKLVLVTAISPTPFGEGKTTNPGTGETVYGDRGIPEARADAPAFPG